MEAESTALVIFGSTGDLAHKKLFPALYRLFNDNNLPSGLKIIAISRQAINTESFLEPLLPNIAEADKERLEQFLNKISIVACDIKEQSSFDNLYNAIQGVGRTIYYYAIPPSLFGELTKRLQVSKCITETSRVVVEKPLGHDLKSAQKIHQDLTCRLNEEQIFRIDHYLGKEAVQNLIALRFGNAILEPLWRAARIRYIQITVAESVGVDDRADYYDRTGALRDMVQNHLLQLLCILAMEPPAKLSPDSVRDEKLKLLQALRIIRGHEVLEKTVRGQYVGSDSVACRSYLDENGVSDHSQTETFVAVKAEIDNWRWAGMPIYLRTGKRLQAKQSEVVIQFADVPINLFKTSGSHMLSNRLVIRLQPEESIKLFMNAKIPGRGMGIESNALNLDFNHSARSRRWTAYERLFLDIFNGDLTLFLRSSEIDAAWNWIDPIIDGWEQHMPKPERYLAGSWGPVASDQLLAKDGYIWFNTGGF